MAGLVAQYAQGTLTTPVEGGSLDASVVVSNDNAVAGKHNSHDADATIHVQSSALSSRPSAGTAQRLWVTTDGLRAYLDSGSVWGELAYLPIAGGTVTGATTFSAALTYGGVTLSNAVTGTGNMVLSASPQLTGTTGLAGATFTTSIISTTALATLSALAATQFSAYASTVSGAVLHGYGTTFDAALKNRAGTDVIGVTANTTGVVMAGALAITGALSGVTTFAASGTATIGPSGTGTTGATLVLDGGSGVGGDVLLDFRRNNSNKAYLGVSGNTNDIIAGTAANDLALRSSSAILFSGDAGTTLHWRISNGGLLQAFGATSGFPAFKRNSTTMEARLADDSAYANFGCLTVIPAGAAVTVGAGQLSYGATTQTTVGAAGGASALPATPTGYVIINIAGTDRVFPFYAKS